MLSTCVTCFFFFLPFFFLSLDIVLLSPLSRKQTLSPPYSSYLKSNLYLSSCGIRWWWCDKFQPPYHRRPLFISSDLLLQIDPLFVVVLFRSSSYTRFGSVLGWIWGFPCWLKVEQDLSSGFMLVSILFQFVLQMLQIGVSASSMPEVWGLRS